MPARTRNFYANSLIPNLAVQDDARYGWGKRPYSWEFSVSAQHELGKGISVNGGVFKRWFGNFLVTDDTESPGHRLTRSSASTRRRFRRLRHRRAARSLPAGLNTTGFYNVNDARPTNNLTGLSDTMFPGSNVIRPLVRIRSRH